MRYGTATRAAGLPLYKYLGGFADQPVRGYASGGYYLDGKTPTKLGEELRGYVGLGFDAVKIKVGRLSVAEEETRVAAARAAIGPDVLLMLDCTNGWRDLETALRYMRMFERHDPHFIEEPFLPDDVANHARLARAIAVPVATGEILSGRWAFTQLIEAGGAAILQPDAVVCGGISEFRRIAATAASHGRSVYPHAYHELHVHLAASAPNIPILEVFTDDSIVNFRRLIEPQTVVADGHVALPGGPGLGFDFADAAVAKYAVQPWETATM